MRQRTHGFTLLEVLIAVAIFSIIGLAVYQLFNSILKTQVTVFDHGEQMVDLQKTFYFIRHDLEQWVKRPIRNEFGDKEEAFIIDENTLEFTRLGWDNPLQSWPEHPDGKRSRLQRVKYENVNNELVRYYWRFLDRAPEVKPKKQVLLMDVTDLHYQFLDKQDTWHSDWPPNNAQSTSSKPEAIKVIFTHKSLGEMEVWVSMSK
ncbi:type II secretion system minor pseudopilin GspJ [Zooshikella harenae]|uniref:Type II secretion system protein J n=1 Tax=Zooshikella harenae TaxID=2827238 RepID=A0ABS5ZED7_9GAMM|nr:type II secretion system minor pseudopilin GspJ [Zooshikella harenae]MBU2712198.1 type II secretion system minor pseudopilin GspJ [Zooshikella harenae]